MNLRRSIGLLGLFALIGLTFRYCVVFVPNNPATLKPSPESTPGGGHGSPPTMLRIPVDGVTVGRLVDTYAQSRESGRRVHNAIDILAPRGTRVLAAAPGVVEKLFQSDRGGKTVYVRSPDRRWIYYYAHLDGYAPGLRQGTMISAGEWLGVVGSTGNASAEAPHLHFAVNRMRPGERWFQGEPVNPYPILADGR